MDGLKELVKECLNDIRVRFAKDDYIRLHSARYYAIFGNGEIIYSDASLILDQPELTYAFIIPKVNYSTKYNTYPVYLSPIILKSSFEAYNGQILIDNWLFTFNDPTINSNQTYSKLKIRNDKIGYVKDIEFSLHTITDKFPDVLKVIMLLSKCTTKIEAIYLFELYEKDKQIDSLSNYVSSLQADLHIKNLTMAGYKELLSTITELVTSKQ